jgi:hypothetical protein
MLSASNVIDRITILEMGGNEFTFPIKKKPPKIHRFTLVPSVDVTTILLLTYK